MKKSTSTSRLLLDILSIDDAEFIIQLVNSKGWLQFIGDRNVHSKEEASAYINKILTTENLYYWVVRKKGDHIPIGIISFLKREYLNNFDIGFAFLPEFTGYGYAYEAAKEILTIAAKDPKYYPILATTIPGNVKSIKVLNKLGLYFEEALKVGNNTVNVYSNAVDLKNKKRMKTINKSGVTVALHCRS